MSEITSAVAQTTKQAPIVAFKSVLNADSVQEQLKNALGENKELFVASLIEVFGTNPSLQKCKPGDIIKQALKAAVLRLPLTSSLGLAYLVVYNNKQKKVDAKGFPILDENTHKEIWETVPTPTFILSYKGFNQLALRSGLYKTIHADVVYEGEFKSRDKLTGKLDISGRKISDKIIGYFAYLELNNGYSANVWWTLEDMAKHAKKYSKSLPKDVSVEDLISTAQNKESNGKVGWLGDFKSMALKTCVKDLITKHGIISIEMQEAMSNDFKVENSDAEELAKTNKTVTFEETEYEEVTETKHASAENAEEELPSFAKK